MSHLIDSTCDPSDNIPDPVVVLKEFYRVCKPGGIVACRDSSPEVVLSLKPDLPSIRQHWDKAINFMRLMHSHPDAGIKLESWAREAGFGSDGGKVVVSKSPIWNTGHLAMVTGEKGEQLMQYGITKEEVTAWADGWKEWEATEGHEFVFEAGEVLCWKGTA